MSLSNRNRRFLYCHDCNAVHRVTPFDSAPVYETDGAELREIPRDDRRDFCDRHVGHGMGELIAIDDRRREPDGFVEPMTVNKILSREVSGPASLSR